MESNYSEKYQYIRRVILRNFKSVVDQEVYLAPLTILVGENSSGKSSLFQVIRLLEQANNVQHEGEQFPLNYEQIQVGEFDDICSNYAQENETISMGFDLNIPAEDIEAAGSTRYETVRADYLRYTGDTIWFEENYNDDIGECYFYLHEWLKNQKMDSYVVKWQVDIEGINADNSASANIRNICLYLSDIYNRVQYQLLNIGRVDKDATIQPNHEEACSEGFYTYPTISESKKNKDNDYSFEVADYEVKDDLDYIKICAVDISGALPIRFIIKSDAYDLIAYMFMREIGQLLFSEEELSMDATHLVQLAAKRIEEKQSRRGSSVKFPAAIYSMPELINACQYDIFNASIEHRKSIANAMADHLSVEDISILINGIKDLFSWTEAGNGILFSSVHYLDNFCANNYIQYLGPLRKSPQERGATYPAVQSSYIGQSGEFTAPVLNHLGSKEVKIPMPNGEQSSVSLVEAVEAWGAQLGLLEAIRVVQQPRIGNTITVKTKGLDKEVPLDAVGVGVSQLLPVLVLCLLSEPESVILLEQPELHLHPALQQRLADFLIAIARSGRQLIVETHSEYMVSRLRRRIAEDPYDELLSISKVIFAERDGQTGITTYRDVELSPYGDIDEWPKGFFDQAAAEEREIIRGGLKKRAEKDF